MRKKLEVAAYSGLAFLIIGAIPFIFSLSPLTNKILLILDVLAGILFVYGFVFIGKKIKSKFLVIMAFVSIAILIISSIFFLFPNLFSNLFISEDLSSAFDGTGSQLSPEQIMSLWIVGLTAYFVIMLILGLSAILFGSALLKIKKVKYAKTAGILNIVAGATFFIFVGFIVMLVANVFEILLLFEFSEKIKKRN